MTETDDTLIGQPIRGWWMDGESMHHVLHVHGDAFARAASAAIWSGVIEAGRENSAPPNFTPDGLIDRVRQFADPLGLDVSFGPATCQPDPVDQVRDLTFVVKG